MLDYIVIAILLFVAYFTVCAARVTLRKSERQEVTVFSDIHAEMLAPITRRLDKFFAKHRSRPKN